MAFYTSRVDDNGNELERRHSARSLTLSGNSSRLDMTSRSCEDKSSSSVRFVNPAAFIEKTPDGTPSDPSDLDAISDDNKCSQTASVSESQSDIVPPLDLQSEENYPTTRDYTFSYRKHCEAAKIVLKPDQAYETWLSAKRKLISDEAARRKKAEEQKREEQEARKQLSEQKLQRWLEQKAKQQSRPREQLKPIDAADAVEKQSPPKPQLSEEEAQLKLEEWDRVKRLKEERRRMLKRQEEQRRRELEEQRRQLSAEAWEKWLSDAANKPKPVPLNRGIFTLRGTISDIYVNPNEWQNITPEPIKEED